MDNLLAVNVLKFRAPNFLSDCNMQTVQTQIRLLVWSGSTLFAIPLGILLKKQLYDKESADTRSSE